MGRPSIDIERTAFSPDILDAIITITTSTTVSAAVDLNGTHLFAIGTPSALSGTALTFQVSRDGVAANYKALYDEFGTQYSIVVAANRIIFLDPTKFAAFRYLKLVSGTAETADRTFKLFTRAV